MAESPAAPGDLELIRAFVNTRELDPMRETLTDPSALRAWLGAHGLASPRARVDADDLVLAVHTREAIRGLLLANNGLPLDPSVARDLDMASRAAKFSLRFDAEGERAELHPEASGAAGAIGRLLSVVATSMTEGTWSRFKACGNDECEWAYFDYSRNHSRRWCEMAVCGNRMKARAYRARHAGA